MTRKPEGLETSARLAALRLVIASFHRLQEGARAGQGPGAARLGSSRPRRSR